MRSHGQNSNGIYTLNTSHVLGNAVQPLVRHYRGTNAIPTGALEHRQVILKLLLIWGSIDSRGRAYDYIIRQRALKNIITRIMRRSAVRRDVSPTAGGSDLYV